MEFQRPRSHPEIPTELRKVQPVQSLLSADQYTRTLRAEWNAQNGSIPPHDCKPSPSEKPHKAWSCFWCCQDVWRSWMVCAHNYQGENLTAEAMRTKSWLGWPSPRSYLWRMAQMAFRAPPSNKAYTKMLLWQEHTSASPIAWIQWCIRKYPCSCCLPQNHWHLWQNTSL